MKYSIPYKVHKKTTELQISLQKPVEEEGQDGKAIRKAGAIFLEIAKSLGDGSDKMDWQNKTTMKIGLMDIATIVQDVRSGGKVNLIHKIEKEGKDQYTSLTIEPGENGSFKWMIVKKLDGSNKIDTVYLNSKEMYLAFNLLEAAVPIINGWL